MNRQNYTAQIHALEKILEKHGPLDENGEYNRTHYAIKGKIGLLKKQILALGGAKPRRVKTEWYKFISR